MDFDFSDGVKYFSDRSGWTFWRVWKFFLTKGDELLDVVIQKCLSCLFQWNKLETNTGRKDKNSFFSTFCKTKIKFPFSVFRNERKTFCTKSWKINFCHWTNTRYFCVDNFRLSYGGELFLTGWMNFLTGEKIFVTEMDLFLIWVENVLVEMVKIIWWVEKSGNRMIITFYGVDFFWQFSMSF